MAILHKTPKICHNACLGPGWRLSGVIVRDFGDSLTGIEGLVRDSVAERDPRDHRGFTALVDPGRKILAMDWTDRGKCWRKLTGSKVAHLGGAGGTNSKIKRTGTYRYEAEMADSAEGYVTHVRLFTGKGANERVLSDWTDVSAEHLSAAGDDQISGAMGKRSSRRSPVFFLLALLLGFIAGIWFGLFRDAGPGTTVDIDETVVIANARDTADLGAAHSALNEAEARIRDLEEALAREGAASGALRQELADLRARQAADDSSGRRLNGVALSLEPCWINAEGTHAQYIYDVHLSDEGIKVTKTFGAARDADYGALGVDGATLDSQIDRYTFAAQFAPLFNQSVAQNCRHFVRVYEGDHKTAEHYKAQRDAVESFFYIYRPHRTRY